MGRDPVPVPYDPMPSHGCGKHCRRCQGELWRWEPGPGYLITVCDGCLEVTLPPGAQLFDSVRGFMARAEELRSFLEGRRGSLTATSRSIAQPSRGEPHGALMDETAAAALL